MNIDDFLKKAKGFNNIKVFQLDENLSLGDCFKLGLDHSQFDFIAKFDDDDYYGKNYLSQAMQSFNKVDCYVVGKSSYYIYFNQSKTLALYGTNKENRFVTRVTDSSLIFKKQVFEQIEIPKIKKAGTFANIQTQLREHGMAIYSTDRLNYMVIRNPEEQHTWKITEDEYLSYKPVKIVAENIEDFTPYIEIDK
jgi:glycosyltransferase involved in cell wall biosynthesis